MTRLTDALAKLFAWKYYVEEHELIVGWLPLSGPFDTRAEALDAMHEATRDGFDARVVAY